MGVNMSIPAAYDECLSQTEQLEWLYLHKENLLTAGANINITRSGDTVVISAIGEGFSPTVNVETIPGGHRVTITDGEGPHVFDVMDGAPGQDGTDGTDGTSVTFATSSISGGTRVTLTDGDHSSHFDVMDGTDGEDITITDVSVISAGTQVTFSDDTVIVIPNGLTGPQGVPGANGRNVFIKYADAQPTQDSDMKDIPSAFMGVYSGTATTAPTTFTDYLWYQIKGAKGDTGNTGATGQDGVSPTLSAEPISGGHRVTMTDAQGTTTFDVMDGENAAAATVTVGSTTTGQPGSNASVTNSGTSSDAVLDFVIPRGNPGPAAYVWTTDDDYTTPNYTFNISDLDGVSGETPKVGDIIFQNVNHRTFLFKINTVDTTTVLTDYFCEITGATGATGQDGADGVTPVISASASVNSSTGTPSVTVTKSGTDAAPSFAFAFSNLKGAKGDTGAGVPSNPEGALVDDGTGTAVWLGPNSVDPTLDEGKVLTLENIQSDPNLPPIIVPQWAAAGGGSGSGKAEFLSFKDRGRSASYTVTVKKQGQPAFNSPYMSTVNLYVEEAVKTDYNGRTGAVTATNGYNLKLEGTVIDCGQPMGPWVLAQYDGLTIDITATNGFVFGKADGTVVDVQLMSENIFAKNGICFISQDQQTPTNANCYYDLTYDKQSNTISITLVPWANIDISASAPVYIAFK